MSLAARAELCAKLIFQDESQKSDLMNPEVTQTQLIALLLDIVGKGHTLEITAVKSDHHDDSALGLHCHFNGYAADCWPLNTYTPGDYMDAGTHDFRQFLVDASQSQWLFQIGLAGSADTPANHTAAGATCFSDDGGDHIHFGANGP
jgi:hypothetical protein